MQLGDGAPLQISVADSFEPVHLKRCAAEFLLMVAKVVHDLCPVKHLQHEIRAMPYPGPQWRLRDMCPNIGKGSTVVWIKPLAEFACPFKFTLFKHDLPAKTACRLVIKGVDGTRAEERHFFDSAAVRFWVQVDHMTKKICRAVLFQLSDSPHVATDVLALETEEGELLASYRVEV